MYCNKRIKLKDIYLTPRNEIRDEWRRNWRGCLKHICDHHNDHDTHHMLNMNIKSGEMVGVLKRGDEVIEVRSKNENEVELMIVNVKNHSMRILRGGEEEMNEVDLNELKENDIIDLNDEGRRWEGGVLKGEVFGYGCLYDEDNGLEYEGWMIEGIKRCYGIEYWNDIGIVKYDGCWYVGMRHGYGLLYDRNGDIEYEGYFMDNCVFDIHTTFFINCNGDLCFHSHLESLMIDDYFNPDISFLFLTSPLIPLKRIRIGDDSFECVNRVVIDGLDELESIKIGKRSFSINEIIREESKCLIMNCDHLRELEIGDESFCWYEVFELKNLPSLISVKLGDGAFENIHLVTFNSISG